jgi:hypothetical protein
METTTMNNNTINPTLPIIPDFAKHISDETLAMLYACHEACKQRLAGKYAEKDYNQRNKRVTLAHIRHCIKETKNHNHVYGDIVTMGDLALKSPECKWETRLAIYALGEEFCARHYSDRGNAIEVARIAGTLIEAEKKEETKTEVEASPV